MCHKVSRDFSGGTTKVSLPADANVAPKFVSVHVTRVGDGYLNTMGITLLRGRGFTVDDGAGAEMVTVISKPLADQLFPNADAAEAIGKRLTFGAVGLVLTAVLVRLNGENMGIPLSSAEPLAYVAGAAIAVLVAITASLAPARRAASVQPMVAMRSV